MPTAIVIVHTAEGFVCASDGLGSWGGNKEQKIFQSCCQNWDIAYAIEGAASSPRRTGEDAFKTAYQEIAEELKSETVKSLADYANMFVHRVGERLQPEFAKGPLSDKHLIILYFAGYFRTVPSMARRKIHFTCDGPRVTEMHDMVPLTGGSHYVAGSSCVTDKILSGSSEFIPFRTPGFIKLKKSGSDSTITLDEAVEAAEKYIAACSTPDARKLDPDNCNGIGGETWIAVIDPKEFRWKRVPSPEL
ncbi:MAG: hypothetical protein ACLQMT_02395 [Candidatus Acidiferrales bacterium]